LAKQLLSQKENFIYSSATCTHTKNSGIKFECERLYNSEIGALEHLKYLHTFLRTTKNVFISLIPEELIDEIAACKPITYSMLKGRLCRKGMRMRVDELRDHWGIFTLDHGLKREKVDLLQGRVGKSIFVRHYLSPAITELRERVFRALELLDPKL
jgi:intergrase/recombinase